MADVSELLLLLSGNAEGAKRAISDTKGGLSGLDSSSTHSGSLFSKLGKIIVGAMEIAAGAALGAAGAGVAAYVEISGAQSKLTAAMATAGPQWTQSQSAIDKTVGSLNGMGVSSADVLAGMTKLTEAHVPLKDQALTLSAAQNFAVASGQSFSASLQAILMASQGAGRGLKQYGINMPVPIATTKALATATTKVATEQDKLTAAEKKYGDNSPQAVAARANLTAAQNALTVATASYANKFAALPGLADQVNNRFGGQAAAWQKTLPGVLNQLKISWENVAYTIGKTLVPYLIIAGKWFVAIEPTVEKLVKQGLTVLGNTIKWIAQNFSTIGPLLAVIVGGFVAWKLAAIAMEAIGIIQMIAGFVSGLIYLISTQGLATTAQWLLNTAMDANPIGVIIIAIAALVGAFVLLYTHVTGFRDVVNAVFGFVVGFIKTAVGIMIGIFKVTPFGFFITHLTDIKNAVVNTWNAVTTFLHDIPGKIIAIFAGAGTWLFNIGKAIIQGLLNGLTSAFKAVTSFVHDIPGHIMDGLKGLFGITSPSKEMAKIGANVMAGLAQGIDSASSKAITSAMRGAAGVSGALSALGGPLAMTGSASLVARGSLAGAGAGGAGGTTLNVNYAFPPGMRASDQAVLTAALNQHAKELVHLVAAARR